MCKEACTAHTHDLQDVCEVHLTRSDKKRIFVPCHWRAVAPAS